jgi:hypothetical protein
MVPALGLRIVGQKERLSRWGQLSRRASGFGEGRVNARPASGDAAAQLSRGETVPQDLAKPADAGRVLGLGRWRGRRLGTR